MGVIPHGPPPRQLTDQERDELRFEQQLTTINKQPGQAETWIRRAILLAIAWAVWSAGWIQ